MREIAQQFAVRLDLLDQAMTAIGQHALLDLARLDQHGPALARQPDVTDTSTDSMARRRNASCLTSA